jgi:hypothetical protein
MNCGIIFKSDATGCIKETCFGKKGNIMIASPSFSNIHSFVMEEFNRLRMQSLRSVWLAKLSRKTHTLKTLSDSVQANLQNKKYMGIQSVPLHQIVGTINRPEDFDAYFRPRKKHLRNRWVNVYLLLDSVGWSPILVHQVGSEYFVEDGHHRVSVARSMGWMFIEAEVWEHSSPDIPPARDLSGCFPSSIPVKACAAD